MKSEIRLKVLICSCLLSAQAIFAQVPELEWVHQLGSTGYDSGGTIAIDSSGNIYTLGYFNGTVDFNPGSGSALLTSAADLDIFIQKLDADGNFLWVKQMGGLGTDYGFDMVVTPSGEIYTCGSFEESVDFDPGSQVFTLSSTGGADIFIQKLDANGNFLWAAQMGGQFDDGGYGIAVDTAGNVYATGRFNEGADFDPGIETAYLVSAGASDTFVLKLDAEGNFAWAKQIGGEYNDSGATITVDASANVYTSGNFSGTVDFDPGPGVAELTPLLNSYGLDVFIQKLDTDGNYLWAKAMGGNSGDEGRSIVVDALENVYTIGRFQNTADFDPGEDTFLLTATGSTDIFVQKLDSAGNFVWARQMGGNGDDSPRELTLDDWGNIYITGEFSETADFNPGAGTANLSPVGQYDIFMVKLTPVGNYVWAYSLGGSSQDLGLSVKVDSSGNIYTCGVFQTTVDFDPGEGITNFTSAGDYDIFVQKLSQCLPENILPDEANLANVSAVCQVTSANASAPSATNSCGLEITATTNLNFPITDQSISEIVWTFTDDFGNETTQTQTINWLPIDVTTVLTGATITATNTNATYQWLDCNNNNAPLAGENEQSFTASANGNYAVQITENSCVDTSLCVEVLSVGLAQFANEVKLTVYPNPSTDVFHIEFESVVKSAVLSVTTLQGKLISTTQIDHADRAQIELNEAPGVYLLSIQMEDGQRSVPLIVSR